MLSRSEIAEQVSKKFGLKEGSTPGPWHVFEKCRAFEGEPDVIVAESVEDAIVCSMGGDLHEVKGNSALIAAAPALRDALISASCELERLRQELKDLREETKWPEVERSRNADKFSREGY
jgi:hypothetical protein